MRKQKAVPEGKRKKPFDAMHEILPSIQLSRKNAAWKRSSKSYAQDPQCYSIDQFLYDAKFERKSNVRCQ